VAGELSRRTQQFWRARSEGEAFTLHKFVRAGLAVAFDQFRLVIIEVEVRRRTGEVEINDPFGLSFVMGIFGRERIDDVRSGCLGRAEYRQGQGTEAERAVAQEMAPRQRLQAIPLQVHEHGHDSLIRNSGPIPQNQAYQDLQIPLLLQFPVQCLAVGPMRSGPPFSPILREASKESPKIPAPLGKR
jgi:hypothetical protein